jgi:N-acetylglucosaminyldiphosphoundecaprenol N-acetyl-beta-D-mannosaminyltransferase
MGLGIDALTERDVVREVEESVATGRGGRILTPNLDQLRRVRRAPELRRHFSSSEVVVADGKPLVWASRMRGTPLPERVAGSSLLWSLCRLAAASHTSIFLLGGNPGTADLAAARLTERFPDLEVAGTLSPRSGFERDPAEVERIVERVASAKPGLVFVGLGFPKQEDLIERLHPRLPSAWLVACGAAIAFAAGEFKRAPVWLQRVGLEWAHRLAQEPRRLFRRYIVEGLPFAPRLFAWSLLTRADAKQLTTERLSSSGPVESSELGDRGS